MQPLAPGGGERPPRWVGPVRVGVLLACLAGAIVALLATQGVLSGPSGGESACDGGTLPEVAALPTAGTAGLRAAALGVFAGRRGRVYEQGAIGSTNLFTDKEPHLEGEPVKHAGGGYEVRRWALDSEGRGDDVVVDALHFGDAAAARRALAFAVGARCRRSRAARPAPFPAGAVSLGWINPDSAYQQDTLFVRGTELYRVGDVPPATGSHPQDAREHARVALATAVLACALPRAGCDPATARGAAARAGLPALAGADASPRWPPDAVRAQAYVRALALRPYDVAYDRAVVRARGAGLLESGPRIVAGCARGPAPEPVAAANSPLFIYGTGSERRSYQSLTVLLGSAAAATRVQASFADALAGGCARRVAEALMRRLAARHRGVRVYGLRLQALPPAEAERYDEARPELASAQRLSYTVALGRRPGAALLHQYEETFVLAYKRAVVVLSIATTGEPLPQPIRNYLESALAGRAVARWGV